MLLKPVVMLLPFAAISCSNTASNSYHDNNTVSFTATPHYSSIELVPLPAGYARTFAEIDSFAAWLRKVGLKNDNTVYLFDGRKKENQTAQFAVLNISVSKKNLQQCADAVMRLRAEYLFSQKQFDKILFTDNDARQYRFKEPYTRPHFDVYLDIVFGMCGSASLAKQLKPAAIKNILPGNVLIRGGFPGHAVMVMDAAIDKDGNKIYLLAQSYMPAQDIHLLNNPSDKNLSPWYKVTEAEKIVTPEYLFTANELKTW
jgi:hypothetical protein